MRVLNFSALTIAALFAAIGTLRADGFDFRSRANHWAFQPLAKTPTGSGIDALAGPSVPEADPRVLRRRLHFDLVGLPPEPEDLQAPRIDEVIDRLLASPHFGEKWARHWLDIVRYAETKGHVTDTERPHAWKYRDYVVDALNADLPYDRFVEEHIAGDLLDPRPGKNGESNVSPTASGALFSHEMHFMAVDPVKQRWDQIDAQIDVVSKAFLGLTVSCARCHDHKTDAIRQRDYYAMAGFFYSAELGIVRTAARNEQDDPVIAKLEAEYNALLERRRKERVDQQRPKNRTGAYFPVSHENGITSPQEGRKVVSMVKELRDRDPNWGLWVRSAVEAENTTDVALLLRGDHSTPGELVPRRFLEVIQGTTPPELKGSGRRHLASQIASPDNPLTARVWANRIWQHLMGEGIVATPNDFGITGSPPSNSALLDYLATRLIESGWSTKTLIREITSSKAYRARRESPRRLEAEALRDSILKVCGTLDTKIGGPSVEVYVPPYATAVKPGNVPLSGPLDGAGRRSIYIRARRVFFDPLLKSFDFPDPGLSTAVRDVSNTPAQALTLLNSPFVHAQAEHWGKKVAREHADFDSAIAAMFLTALARPPDDEERELLRALEPQGFAAAAHVILNMPEFRYVD